MATLALVIAAGDTLTFQPIVGASYSREESHGAVALRVLIQGGTLTWATTRVSVSLTSMCYGNASPSRGPTRQFLARTFLEKHDIERSEGRNS